MWKFSMKDTIHSRMSPTSLYLSLSVRCRNAKIYVTGPNAVAPQYGRNKSRAAPDDKFTLNEEDLQLSCSYQGCRGCLGTPLKWLITWYIIEFSQS